MANDSMIASCPKCGARYRMDRSRLKPEGVRLRCNRCEAVFRVAAPSAPAPGPAPAAAPAPPPAAPPAPAEAAAPPAPGTPPAAPAAQPPAPAAPAAQPPAPTPPAPAAQPPAPAPPEVPPPAAPAPPSVPAASGLDPTARPRSEEERRRLVLVADADVEAGKSLANTLVGWGLEPLLVHDGVEAVLGIQRALPRAVILDAALPKMFGFQVCELVKRNESLRSIHVVLMGAVHHRDRYRRDPSELYGADAYVERHELPEALRPLFVRFGFEVPGAPASAAPPQPAAPPQTTPIEVPAAEPVAPGDRITAELPTPGHEEAAAAPVAPGPVASASLDDDPLLEIDDEPFDIEEPSAPPAAAASPEAAPGSEDPAVAAAERLARIIVSDVILYNAERFDEGLQSGKIVESLEAELEEGRALFEQRVAPEVRTARDFLVEELLRVARSRGMKA